MNLLRYVSGLQAQRQTSLSPLGDFVDGLLQAFEDRRPGLKDEALTPGDAERFFTEVFDRERPRLRGGLRLSDPHLLPARLAALGAEVDELVGRVLVPAYARLAAAFTLRQRNDFFVTRGAARGAERMAWVLAGTLLGGFLVVAPFVPLWSKHWIWLFGLGGLFFPELRRYIAFKRYERDLNDLVLRSARELERLREAYLLEPEAEPDEPLSEQRHEEGER